MKKIIALLLSAVMLAGAMSMLASAQDFVYDNSFIVGDANGDEVVNARDVLAIRRHLVDSESEIDTDAGDVNCDGASDARDVLLLRRSFVDVIDLADYENTTQVAKLTIAGNDISNYVLVIPTDATPEQNSYYAAQQLQNYVKVATGIELPIVTNQNPPDKMRIKFTQYDEDSAEAEEMGLALENYKYEVTNGELFIYGTRRGCLYSVYEILEDYLGYRFYLNDYTFIYKSRVVDIPEGTNVYHVPTLNFRHANQGFGGGDNGVLNHYFPRRLNGTQLYAYYDEKYGTLTGPQFINAHSYGYYWKMATGDPALTDYNEKYKTGFQQNEATWNPCSTSNEDYEYLFRGLLETIRMVKGWGRIFWKETNSMSFSICDNPYICPCRNCKFISSTGEDKRLGTRLGAGGAGLNVYLANRACRDIKAYYPGRAADNDEFGLVLKDEYPEMKIYSIIYEHTPPQTNLPEEWKDKLLPEENLIIMYCGTACNNHYFFEAEEVCGDSKDNLGRASAEDVRALKAWGNLCKEQGAEMWFWFYPVTYTAYLVDSPVIFNIYYDFKYMVEECGITGIYYEGGGRPYQFQLLKSHMASLMMWNPTMTFDEYVEYMKEYMWMYYGDGVEELYQYIVMVDEAANAIKYDSGINTAGCFINNFDRPGDMYDYEYTRDNYVEMRELLLAARDKANTADQRGRFDMLLVTCDFMGLSANYETWYLNGTPEQKQTYIERYTWLYNYIKDNNIQIYSGNAYTIPETLDVSIKPIIAFYGQGSYNENNADTWGYTPAPQGGWGFGG